MHPGQQVRVAGGVGRAVGQLADDAFVDAPDPLDQSLGIGQRAVGGGRDELTGATQAPEQVVAEVEWSTPRASGWSICRSSAPMPPIIMLLKSPWTFQQAASGPNRPGSPFGDSKSTPPTASPVGSAPGFRYGDGRFPWGSLRRGRHELNRRRRLEPSRAAGRRDGCAGQRLRRLSINPAPLPDRPGSRYRRDCPARCRRSCAGYAA